MHRYSQSTQQLQSQPPTSQPYPGQDSVPPPPQPYPGYPPPHDARRSNSPYVHPPGIPIPSAPAPPSNDPKQQSSTAAPPSSESPPSSGRPTRKRKLQSPAPDPQQQQMPPPPHAPMPGQPPQYDTYYAQPHQPLDAQGNPVAPQPPGGGSPGSPGQSGSGTAAGGRQLSTSKRAEQNRKAQRAFRERRDAHVKALESRSQLLDAALASADEANRRWEECRALVDQLRVENAALRAALGAAAAHAQGAPPPDPTQKQQQQQQQQQGQENGAQQSSRGGSVEREADD